MSPPWDWFVVGEKNGGYTVVARVPTEEEAEDAASGDEFGRIYIAEITQVVGQP